ARAGPGVEVRAGVDRAGAAVALADAPVLREGPGALDGGLVVAHGVQEGVRASVDVGGAAVVGSATGVVRAVGFDDVVLHQRVGGPAVERQVAVAAVVDPAAVLHVPAPAVLPALAADPVVDAVPLGAVVASRAEGHRGRALGVGPEGVVVPVVGALLVGGDGLLRLGGAGHHQSGAAERQSAAA